MKWHVRQKRRNFILMPSDYLDLGSASDWLKQISHTVRPIRRITQVDSEASSVWNFCTHFLDAFSQGSQWCHHEMSHVFSVVSSRNVACFLSGVITKCRMFSQWCYHEMSHVFSVVSSWNVTCFLKLGLKSQSSHCSPDHTTLSSFNRPFAWWNHFTTTTRILQWYAFLCELGLLLFKPCWDYKL